MKRLRLLRWIILAIFTAAFGALASQPPLPLKPFDGQDVAQLLTVLVLIFLFLERSLEVFVVTWRSRGAEALAEDVRKHQRQHTRFSNLTPAECQHDSQWQAANNALEEARKITGRLSRRHPPGGTVGSTNLWAAD